MTESPAGDDTHRPSGPSGPENPTGPETITEALAFLAERGYTREFEIDGGGLGLRDAAQLHALATAVVDFRFRFEGASDPGDESIVLGVTCGRTRRGVVVSAYGPAADPAHVAVLQALSRPPES